MVLNDTQKAILNDMLYSFMDEQKHNENFENGQLGKDFSDLWRQLKPYMENK
jgi:hypothetical protein